MTFPFSTGGPSPRPGRPYATLWREAQRLRSMRFDVAYVMRFDFWWGAALARLAGIPVRIGYALPGVQPFLSEAVPYAPGLHEVEQNMRLVEAGPHPLPHSQLWERGGGATRFTITPADAAWAAARLASSGLGLPDCGSLTPAPGTRNPKPGSRNPEPETRPPEPCFISLHPRGRGRSEALDGGRLGEGVAMSWRSAMGRRSS